jgi:hypothetical protein
VVSNVSSDTRIGVIVLRLRIEHAYSRKRTQRRAFKNIERHVLSRYQATLLPSGEHQVHILYRTEHDLDERMDDLLFEIAGEAQMSGCYSEPRGLSLSCVVRHVESLKQGIPVPYTGQPWHRQCRGWEFEPVPAC